MGKRVNRSDGVMERWNVETPNTPHPINTLESACFLTTESVRRVRSSEVGIVEVIYSIAIRA